MRRMISVTFNVSVTHDDKRADEYREKLKDWCVKVDTIAAHYKKQIWLEEEREKDD